MAITIRILSTTLVEPPIEGVPLSRTAVLVVTDNGTSYEYVKGGLPPEGDLQTLLDAQTDVIWAEAQTYGHEPSIAAIAKLALITVDWQGKITDITAGRAVATQIRNDANIPLATRTRIANLFDGLIDHTEENWIWWRRLMQVMALADE